MRGLNLQVMSNAKFSTAKIGQITSLNQKPYKRVFFALWPEQATRQEISRVFKKSPQSSQPGQSFRASNLHLTLAFPGNVSTDQLDCYIEAARKLKSASFDLELNSFGYFKQARVFWLGPTTIPTALSRLQSNLIKALTHCGYQPESQLFTPHITLMRKTELVNAPVCDSSILWKVNQFVLLESIQTSDGVIYQPLKTFDLYSAD